MALLTPQQDALVNAKERVRGELLADLLTAPRGLSTELLLRGRNRGIKIDDLNMAVVLMHPHNEHPSELVRLLNGLQILYGGLAGEYQGLPTLLLRGDSSRQIAQDVHKRIKSLSPNPVLVCAGPVTNSAAELQKRQSTLEEIADEGGQTSRPQPTTRTGHGDVERPQAVCAAAGCRDLMRPRSGQRVDGPGHLSISVPASGPKTA